MFPDEEKFGLTNQLRRASISVASILTGGISRQTNKDITHFTTLSSSSLKEVLNQIIIDKGLNFLNEDNYQVIRIEHEKTSDKLNALRKTQLSN